MKISPSFISRLKREEGFAATSFWDDAPGGGSGQWTWGHGTVAPGPNCKINMEDAEAELMKEVAEAERDYDIVFQKDPPGLTQARYDSIIDMLFNLGLTRFGEFYYTIGAIREGNWTRAAAHAQQSLWYRQVGNRAKQIVEEFRTGIGECDRYQKLPEPVSADPEGKAIEKVSPWNALLGFLKGILRVVRCGGKNKLQEGGLK